MKIAAIVNPVAGNGRVRRLWHRVEKVIREYGYRFQSLWTEHPGHGRVLAGRAREEGVVLYATPECEELVETYRVLKRRGLRRTETSIVLPGQQ